MRYVKEIVLLEAILLIILWFMDEYIGWLSSLIMMTICGGILIVSLLTEWIERSKIEKPYFYMLLALTLVPMMIICVFFLLSGGNISWLHD